MALTRGSVRSMTLSRSLCTVGAIPPRSRRSGRGSASSPATVHKHVSNLEKKGLLKRDYNRSRSIDVLPPRGRARQAMAAAPSWPLVGRIAAGRP